MERTQRVEALFEQEQDFFVTLTTNHERTIAWLRGQRLLPARRICCNQICFIRRNARSIDGEMFRCNACGSKYNIRDGTRWERFRRTPLVLIVRIVFHYFPNQYSANRTFEVLNALHVRISYETVKRIYREIRRSISDYMNLGLYSRPLRGRIQMDEALFTHRAGPGRRGSRQVWVVGMLEERTSEAFCFVVQNRNARTINQLVQQYILPGSFIIHDGWGGYNGIPHNYRHHRCLNREGEVDNTSRVEGLWGELRAFVRNIYSGGIIEGNIRTFMQELNFRRRVRTLRLSFVQELVFVLRNYQ